MNNLIDNNSNKKFSASKISNYFSMIYSSNTMLNTFNQSLLFILNNFYILTISSNASSNSLFNSTFTSINKVSY